MARRRTGVPHGPTTDAMVYLVWSESARDGKIMILMMIIFGRTHFESDC